MQLNTPDDVKAILLADDDYMNIAERFNKLSHDDKFTALSDTYMRGVIYRASKYNGSLICRLPNAAWVCGGPEERS